MNILKVAIKEAGYIDAEKVLKNINFSVNRGELVGLIGGNGAGKSTTIKAIIDLAYKVEGKITIPNNTHYMYIPEQPVFYDELTLWEHLEFIAKANSVKGWEQKAEKLLQEFHLSGFEHNLPSSFSKGMQQKSIIVSAFMVQPDLYIIDEPFIGLDPNATSILLDLLIREKERGAGILMSTHVLDTAEKICDSFILISSGKVIANGTLKHIQQLCSMPEGSLLECFNKLWKEGYK